MLLNLLAHKLVVQIMDWNPGPVNDAVGTARLNLQPLHTARQYDFGALLEARAAPDLLAGRDVDGLSHP